MSPLARNVLAAIVERGYTVQGEFVGTALPTFNVTNQSTGREAGVFVSSLTCEVTVVALSTGPKGYTLQKFSTSEEANIGEAVADSLSVLGAL